MDRYLRVSRIGSLNTQDLRVQEIAGVGPIVRVKKDITKSPNHSAHSRQNRPVGSVLPKDNPYEPEIIIPQTGYDTLDSLPFAGYLLYSYDQKGEHSIIGGDTSPRGYGSGITHGMFSLNA